MSKSIQQTLEAMGFRTGEERYGSLQIQKVDQSTVVTGILSEYSENHKITVHWKKTKITLVLQKADPKFCIVAERIAKCDPFDLGLRKGQNYTLHCESNYFFLRSSNGKLYSYEIAEYGRLCEKFDEVFRSIRYSKEFRKVFE